MVWHLEATVVDCDELVCIVMDEKCFCIFSGFNILCLGSLRIFWLQLAFFSVRTILRIPLNYIGYTHKCIHEKQYKPTSLCVCYKTAEWQELLE